MPLLPDFTNFTELVLNSLFLGLLFVQFFWVLFFFLRVATHKNRTPKDRLPPVSIIIAARNEEDNLFENLPFIAEQDYPNFEIIVINHQSVDGTSYILKAFAAKYPHLRTINIEKNNHLSYGKKFPLTLGIKGAKYEHLIFTDADCKPMSEKWLREMAGQFSTKKKIVLGYGPYRKEKGILNRLIRIDTTFIALYYLSLAKAGLPYMGVGRNLGYTKSLFLDNRGFKSHYSISSGDDDLFIQEIAKKKNYTVCLSSDSACFSEAKTSWKDWFVQKGRHFTTAPKYSKFIKFILGIYPFTLLTSLGLLLTLLIVNLLTWIPLGFFILLTIIKWITLGFSFKRLKQKSLIWGVLLWDVVYALLAPILYYTVERPKNEKWK